MGLLFVLTGPAVSMIGIRAVPASVLAAVALALTLLSVVELLGGSSERGGTYILIQETLGGLGAFLAGWSILAGGAGLSAALSRAVGDHLLLLFPSSRLSATHLALVVFGLLVLAELFQTLPRRPLLWPLAVVLFTAFGFVVVSVLPQLNVDLYRSVRDTSLHALMHTVASFAAGYAAFEAMVASRRQIRHAGRLLPPALFGTLVFSGLALTGIMSVAAGLGIAASPTSEAFARALANATFLPWWTAPLLAVVALALAAGGCLMVAARQMHALSRGGGLPAGLHRVYGPFPMPPLLFGVLAALSLPLIAQASPEWLTNVAAGLFLVAMTLLNIAAIHSHRTEPERRRPFLVPFYPLVPAVAIALNLVLLAALSPAELLGGAGWLTLGILVYLAYARRHQVAAQEGLVVFGRDQRRERKAGVYRILVPLSAGAERRLALRLAAALAHRLDGEVIPLQVIPMADPLAIEEGRRLARERNTLFQWSTRLAENIGVPTFPITRLAPSVSQGIIETALEEEAGLILMPWAVVEGPAEAGMGDIVGPVIRRAPCDVAVVAYHAGESDAHHAGETETARVPAPWQPRSILVPTAGGPHAPLAVRIALALALEYGATITAIYVTSPDASAEDMAAGRERIEQTLAAVREEAAHLPSLNGREDLAERISIESRVITAESVVAGITEAGTQHDLVLIGASEESLIDQVLFGTVAEQVARACPTPVVMVKRYRGLPRFWLQRAWDALYEAVPELSSEERIEVYKEVRRGARPDVDFFVMMGLSAIIATFGLLQNSTAVIIGAMLVAPLFTPILALSLAIVQGDVRLFRLAVESTLKGIALAIGLAILLTYTSPLRITLTEVPEIVARSRPNLFDLVVALASGAAGAYAIARKDVAASLPGVAIAAALVPPLAVVGIGLARADLRIAGGGTLLFITNLTAITLAGAVTLLLLGFRPAHRGDWQTRVRVGLTTALVLLLLIAIPLGLIFIQLVNTSQVHQAIQDTLTRELKTLPDLELAGFEFEDHTSQVDVTVTFHAREPVSQAIAKHLDDELSDAIGRPVRLRVVVIPVTEIEVPAK
ncbi:MAG: DUF389 domain-containing protein [Chloroflexi bacterium]|nr:MAG: DUF389 domain-containing protein [Chloroflexota bacterium]